MLKKCLASVFEFCKEQNYEVIVIDNNSSDRTIEMIKQEYPQVKLIALPKNIGFAGANNIGIRQARGDYILLLNPDTEFIEDSLSRIAVKMEEDKFIGVLGCALVNPNQTLQPSVRRFPTITSQLVILFKLHHLFPNFLNHYLRKDFDYLSPSDTTPLPRRQAGYPLLPEEGSVVDVDQVMGAFFCVRREVFDKIGLLDDKYFIWFEEVDLCRRAKRAGFKVVYWPGTKIIHHGGQSFKQQMTLKKQWWFFKSALRYFTKKDTRN